MWLREHGRFIPYLANWLRGQRWLDELPDAPEQESPSVDVAALKAKSDAFLETLRPAPDPELKKRFDAFASRFPDSDRMRGPAFGLWALLQRRKKLPAFPEIPQDMGIMDYLTALQRSFA